MMSFRHASAVGLTAALLIGTATPVALAATDAPTPPADTQNAASEQARRVSPDRTTLLDAVKDAKAAGLTVTTSEKTPLTVSTKKDLDQQVASIEQTYKRQAEAVRKDIAALKKAQADYTAKKTAYEKDKAAYDKAQADYKTKKAAYDKAKAAFDKKLDAQTSSDPFIATQPDEIFFKQPFSINKDRDSIVAPGAGWRKVTDGQKFPLNSYNFVWGPGLHYNSDSQYVVAKPVTAGQTYTVKWTNVATDIDTGRKLNATIVVDHIVTTSNTGDVPFLFAYSNFTDNFSIKGITSMRQTITYSYADTGAPYDKPYYTTIGSLNAQGKNGQRYEFVAPGNGIKASFINKNSLIAPTAQTVSGTGSKQTKRAFMVPQSSNQQRGIPDNQEALRYLGVTFLAEGTASFNLGVSGSGGKEPSGIPPQSSVTQSGIEATYNHIMFATDTVAPLATAPVPPKPPTVKKPTPPKAPTPKQTTPTVAFQDVLVQLPATVKVGDKQDRKVFTGEQTTQHISATTDSVPMKQFGIGDLIYYTKDGRLPVTVDLAKVRVTNRAGDDVTRLFTLTQDDTQMDGVKVHRILATAKNPSALPLTETFTLHVTQTAVNDGIADKEVDKGFALKNGKMLITKPVSYDEVIVQPVKKVTDKGGINIDGKTVMPGDALVYSIDIEARDLARTQEKLTSLGISDDYDQHYFTPIKDQLAVQIITNNQKPDTGTNNNQAAGDAIVNNQGEQQVIAPQSLVPQDQYTVTWDEAKGAVTVMFNDPAKAAGKDYRLILPGTVNTKAKPGDFENTAAQLVNKTTIHTNKVKNKVPGVAPIKQVRNTKGENIDTKKITPGDILSYQVTADTVNLTNLAYQVDRFGLTDTYEDNEGDVIKDSIKVYEFPAGTDTKTFTDLTTETVKKASGSDVTNLFTINDDGHGNLTALAKTSNGRVVTEMGKVYVLDFDFQTVKNVKKADSVENVAREIINDNGFTTNTVTNPYEPPTPPAPVNPLVKTGGQIVNSPAGIGGILAGLAAAATGGGLWFSRKRKQQ